MPENLVAPRTASLLEAVESHAEHEKRVQNFVREALAADADIERTGEVYRAEDVHAWIERLAKGQRVPRPRPFTDFFPTYI